MILILYSFAAFEFVRLMPTPAVAAVRLPDLVVCDVGAASHFNVDCTTSCPC
jgi:hypothetical protein